MHLKTIVHAKFCREKQNALRVIRKSLIVTQFSQIRSSGMVTMRTVIHKLKPHKHLFWSVFMVLHLPYDRSGFKPFTVTAKSRDITTISDVNVNHQVSYTGSHKQLFSFYFILSYSRSSKQCCATLLTPNLKRHYALCISIQV